MKMGTSSKCSPGVQKSARKRTVRDTSLEFKFSAPTSLVRKPTGCINYVINEDGYIL
jgi:hypothetical protein